MLAGTMEMTSDRSTEIVRGHKNPNLSTCNQPFVGVSATSFLAKKSRRLQAAGRKLQIWTLRGHSNTTT